MSQLRKEGLSVSVESKVFFVSGIGNILTCFSSS